MAQFAKNVSFFSVATDHTSFVKPSLVGHWLQKTIQMVATKSLKVATPIHTYSIADFETAFRFMQSGKSAGKIVLTLDSSDKISVSLC